MPPKVTVIIPVYNTGKYLRGCLDGVVNQTMREIEIICIDDGSTDDSPAILRDYREKDNRIIVVTQENRGAGAARNAGLDIARGEYLSILDSDDIYDIAMIEKMYNRTEELQADMTVCLSKSFDDITGKISDRKSLAADIRKDVFSYKDALKKYPEFDFFIGWAWDKLFRKSFIARHGIRFQEISHSNDAFFVFTAMYAAERITVLRESLVRHRINREGSVASTHNKNPLCFFEMHGAVKEGMEKLGIFQTVKKHYGKWVIRHSLWVLSNIKTPKSFIEAYSQMEKYYSLNDIYELPLEYYIEKWRYNEMQQILMQPGVEYSVDQNTVGFPLKIRGLYYCSKENGPIYAIRLVIGKCFNKMRVA